MKIMLVSSWFPSRNDPVNGIFVLEHAKALQTNIDDIVVVHPIFTHDAVFFSRTCSFFEEYNGISVLRIRVSLPGKLLKKLKKRSTDKQSAVSSSYKTLRKIKKRGLMDKIFAFLLSLYYGLSVNKTLRIMKSQLKDDFDLVHAYVPYPSGAIACRYARNHGARFVYTEVSSNIYNYFNRAFPGLGEYHFREFQKMINFTHILFTVSQVLSDDIHSLGITTQRTIVEHTIYDGEVFYFDSKQDKIREGKERIIGVFCGILKKDNRKGLGVLIDAVSEMLPDEREKMKIRVVGYGEGEAYFREMSRQRNVDKNFDFLGRKSLAELSIEMKQADFFTIPSFAEGMPCVLMEAMACGLPVIGSAIGGIKEMITDKTGYLVHAGNVSDLKEALKKMLIHYRHFNREYIAQQVNASSYKEYSRRMLGHYQSLF